jgi:hypothetical protein
MRKNMLLLALALAATASLTAPSAQAGFLPGGGPYHSCPVCTTYSDGSQCCITCQCNDSGVMLCPMIGCAPVSEL